MKMTVDEAALKWGVNRRTVLKWMLGKDGTGRGKRMVEGEDYVKEATPRGPVWYVLTDQYPKPLLAPIPKYARMEKRYAREERAAAAEAAGEPVAEFEAPPEGETEVERRSAPKKARTTRKAAKRAESIPEASDTDTQTEIERRSKKKPSEPRQPKAKREPKGRVTDEDFDSGEEEVAPRAKRAATAPKAAPESVAAQVLREAEEYRKDTGEVLDEEGMALLWLEKSGLPTDEPFAGSLAIRVASDLNTNVAGLGRLQQQLIRALEKQLSGLPVGARRLIIHPLLAYLQKSRVLPEPTTDPVYWTAADKASSLRGFPHLQGIFSPEVDLSMLEMLHG
jgi:hypothetical protein